MRWIAFCVVLGFPALADFIPIPCPVGLGQISAFVPVPVPPTAEGRFLAAREYVARLEASAPEKVIVLTRLLDEIKNSSYRGSKWNYKSYATGEGHHVFESQFSYSDEVVFKLVIVRSDGRLFKGRRTFDGKNYFPRNSNNPDHWVIDFQEFTPLPDLGR